MLNNGQSERQSKGQRGRPKSASGPLQNRPIGFDAGVNDTLEEMAVQQGTTVPELVRSAVNQWLSPAAPPSSDVNNFRAPYLSAVPCGPWDDAINSGESFVISEDVADVLEAQDGDIWCSANGQSMEGAGIQDGFVVLLRPYGKYAPRRGEIVLVQAFPEGEEPLGTIKRFNGMDGTKPKLLDGEDKEYQLPPNTTKVEFVARAVGVVGRL